MARIIKQVHITDDAIFLDGNEFPFYLEEQGPTIEWKTNVGSATGGALTLPILIFSDETRVTDDRTPG